MKTTALLATCLLSSLFASAQLGVTVNNLSGTTVLTCKTPVISLNAGSTYTAGPVTYVWAAPSSSAASGSSINVSSPGVYTLTASSGTISTVHMVSISINTTAPSSALSPTYQTITCNLSSVQSVTLVNTGGPSGNFTHKVISPQGATFLAMGTPTAIYFANATGTFTYVLTNEANGCSTVKTFTQAATQGLPTFSLVSPQSFTLGCAQTSIAVINIINASATNSNQVPNGGPVSYTLLSPAASSITQPGALSPNSSYTTSIPGTYTAVTRDNSSLCDTRVPFTVLANTSGPALDTLLIPTQALNCSTISIVLKAGSGTPNVSYLWSYTGSTVSATGNTISVSANPSLAPTATLANVYTLTLSDQSTYGNFCKTSTVIPIYKNTFLPLAKINSGNGSVITCNTPTLMLTNISTSGIPANSPFQNNLPVVAFMWEGPTPQASQSLINTYVAAVPGVYTLTALDLNNGCKSATTVVVSDGRIYPVITPAQQPYLLLCPNGTVALSPAVAGATTSLSYSWQAPANAIVSGNTTGTLTTNYPGTYTVTVKNNVSGCMSSTDLYVFACVGLDNESAALAGFRAFPNPGKGLYTIELPGSADGLRLEVYNTLGMLLGSQSLSDGKNTVSIEEQPAGIYFFRVSRNTTTPGIMKVVKE